MIWIIILTPQNDLRLLNNYAVLCHGSPFCEFFFRQCACAETANRHVIFWRPLANNWHLFFSQSIEKKKKSQTSECQKLSGSALAAMQKHFTIDYFWRLFTALRKRVVKLYLNRRKINYLSKANFYQLSGDEKSFPASTLYIYSTP